MVCLKSRAIKIRVRGLVLFTFLHVAQTTHFLALSSENATILSSAMCFSRFIHSLQTFQKLIKYLNLQTAVPIVDPAMYIKRFAAKLDLGNKTNAVCMTALKVK